MFQGNYKDGREEGLWEYYGAQGQLIIKGNYKDGMQEGFWGFYIDGQLTDQEDNKGEKEEAL